MQKWCENSKTNPVTIQKMPVEATDVDQPFQDAPDAPDAQTAPDAPAPVQTEPQDAPQKRGRPAGAKDKQPRKRPVRAAELNEVPRPVTRRSAPPRKVARRVQIVESADEASSSPSEIETPRTARHRQWAEYRQQKNDAYQHNVNRYAALFDRMLA